MSVLSSNHSALSQETHSAYSAGTTSESVMPSVYEESVCESLSSKPGMETYLVSELSEEDEEPIYKNPFTIPPDIDIFAIRNKERKKAKAERERMKTMKIHEKMTYSVKNKAKERGLRKALKKEEEEENRKQETDEERLKALQECLSWKIAIKKDYPLEKETFRDYINDRREIFLLEYAIAVKREEIQKLEKIAKKEERKLEKAEYNLEKDIAIFDEFLKENHKSSVQALKIAEKESAAKAKKIVQIHAIGSQIMSLQSDITRFENSLREYKMYRDFLYQLSPKEWQEEYEKKHGKQLKTADKESASEKSLTIEMNTNAIDVPSSLLSVESVNSSLSPGTRPQLKSLLKPLSTENLNSSQDQESEICSDEDEEPELYFTDPQQLLSVFAEMEEQNFSYLCNFQETQKEINELQHTFINAQQRKLREEKEQQQKQMQEERLQRALERAQANIEKKTGRRLMFRSSPPARKEKKEQSQEQRDKEKEEMLYYFT
eukprot:XP_015148846.1 cilia- and flagella-associated protein 100 isoform X2 [Gallus gallus]